MPDSPAFLSLVGRPGVACLTMEISGIKINAVRLTKPALELIRSMAGREIRATVVQAQGGALLLRSGGTLIEARASGLKQPLAAGQRLFLKVEQDSPGRFRLVVLDPPRSGVTASPSSLLQQHLPPGPLQQIFGNFLRAFGGRPAATMRTSAARGTAQLDALPPEARAAVDRMQTGLRELSARIPALEQSALATILQQIGMPAEQANQADAPDFWLAQGWGQADGEDADAAADEYVQSLGRLAEPPHYFLSEFQIGSAGRIHVLLLSAESAFRRLSLFLHAERPETAAVLAERLPQELPGLIGDDIGFERIEVLSAGPPRGEGGGGLLDLQG